MITTLPINPRYQVYSCRLTARRAQARTLAFNFADSCTRKHPAQPTARSFAPTSSSCLYRTILSAPATLSSPMHHPSA